MDDVERLGAVPCFTDHFDVGFCIEQHAKPGAHEGLVVGEGDADHDVTSARTGSTARTTKPPPGTAPALTVPPRPAARSRIPAIPCPGWSFNTVDPRPSSATSISTVSGR